MTRRQWTGLAGVLFGVLMIVGVFVSGTTPNSTGSGAVDRYTEYWSEKGNQDKASLGSIVMTYACVLLVCFAAALSRLLRRGDDGPLPSLVLGAGAASAALIGVGGPLVNGAGLAAAETGYRPDGNMALMLEAVGYYALTAGIMLAATMAVAAGLANRRSGVLPGWTLVLSALLGLVALGSIFTAWVGFMLFPIWAVVIGLLLLVTRGAAEPATAT